MSGRPSRLRVAGDLLDIGRLGVHHNAQPFNCCAGPGPYPPLPSSISRALTPLLYFQSSTMAARDRLAALRVSKPEHRPPPSTLPPKRQYFTCLTAVLYPLSGSAARREWVRSPLGFRIRKAGADDRRLVCSNDGANNPYSNFDDRNYEMNDVRSTTNLTAGLSGGAQESMTDFYDEVTKRFLLSKPSAPYRHPIPNRFPLNPRSSLVLILGFLSYFRSRPSKAV